MPCLITKDENYDYAKHVLVEVYCSIPVFIKIDSLEVANHILESDLGKVLTAVVLKVTDLEPYSTPVYFRGEQVRDIREGVRERIKRETKKALEKRTLKL